MISLSNTLLVLLKEYPGDDAWDRFVSTCPDVSADLSGKLPIEADILKVLYWKKGNNFDRVASWLQKPVPALDGHTVTDIIKMQEGKTILRTVIMRMP